MFVWFAWYRLIFAKGMNNRNTFVFVCVFQGLRLMSPLMGVFLTSPLKGLKMMVIHLFVFWCLRTIYSKLRGCLFFVQPNQLKVDVWSNNYFLCQDLVHHPIEATMCKWMCQFLSSINGGAYGFLRPFIPEPRKKRKNLLLSIMYTGCLLGILTIMVMKESPHNWVELPSTNRGPFFRLPTWIEIWVIASEYSEKNSWIYIPSGKLT